MTWNGFPPDRHISQWWWIQHHDNDPVPTYWDHTAGMWRQGGLLCGGSCFPEHLAGSWFSGNLKLVGRCTVELLTKSDVAQLRELTK